MVVATYLDHFAFFNGSLPNEAEQSSTNQGGNYNSYTALGKK